MSRFAGRLRSLLLCSALLFAAGCGGAAEPDLLQALPAPAPPPTSVPTPPNRNFGASGDGVGAGMSAVDWVPVHRFDFDGTRLDTRVWNPYNSVGAFGNGFRRPSAIGLSDGKLQITARRNVSGGMNHEYDQLYGRWEFRARTDRGRGFSAAILLWPKSENKDDGELDMMEVPREQRDAAHFVMHWGAENNIDGTLVNGDFTQWHTFAMDWLPDRITWYVDGVKQYETRDRARIPNKPMHLTIQLDQGPKKDWMPGPDETTPPEVRLEVDWVRIYKMPRGYR